MTPTRLASKNSVYREAGSDREQLTTDFLALKQKGYRPFYRGAQRIIKIRFTSAGRLNETAYQQRIFIDNEWRHDSYIPE